MHASLVAEAKEHVFNVERRITEQFEQQRLSLRAQAEAYVAKVDEENRRLRSRVAMLELQLVRMRASGEGKGGDDEEEAIDEDMDMDHVSVASSLDAYHAEHQGNDLTEQNDDEKDDHNENEDAVGDDKEDDEAGEEPRGYERLNGRDNDQENNPYALNAAQKPGVSDIEVKPRVANEKRAMLLHDNRKHNGLPKMPATVMPAPVDQVTNDST